MIVDAFENIYEYRFAIPYLNEIINFYEDNIINLIPGKYNLLNDNLFVIIAENRPDADSEPKLEAHRKYIDLQVCIIGEFELGWKNRESCRKILKEYDESDDYELYNSQEELKFNLTKNHFAVFYPNDAHKVYPPKKYVKKAIFKINYEQKELTK